MLIRSITWLINVFPVDAGMRQMNEMAYMHNRCRMIVASFFAKDLLLDWRMGEKYFMWVSPQVS